MEQLRLREHDLVWREVEDEIVILDMRESLYASLNEAGRVLWLRLVEGATFEELEQELTATYGLSPEAAHRDAHAFVSSLSEHGLLG